MGEQPTNTPPFSHPMPDQVQQVVPEGSQPSGAEKNNYLRPLNDYLRQWRSTRSTMEEETKKSQQTNKDLEAAREELASVEEAPTERASNLHILRQEFRETKAKLAASKWTRAALERKLEDTKDVLKEMNNDLIKSENELDETKYELEESKAKLASSECGRAILEKEFEEIKGELKFAEELLQRANSGLDISQRARATLQKELQEECRLREPLKDALNFTKNQLLVVERERNSAKAEATMLLSTNALLRGKLVETEHKLQNCEAQNTALRRQLTTDPPETPGQAASQIINEAASHFSTKVEVALSQATDKIDALDQTLKERLLAFGNRVMASFWVHRQQVMDKIDAQNQALEARLTVFED